MKPDDSSNSEQTTTENAYKGKSGIKRIINAFHYSIDGLKVSFANESAFRQELGLACILVPLALFLPFSITQKALLLFSIGFVLVIELINTAVEAIVDRISLDVHPLSKTAKDAGSAAVLLSCLTCALVWLLCLRSLV